MKTRVILYFAVAALVMCFACPVMAADVAQGKAVTYDKDKKILVIDEYDTNFSKTKSGEPTGKQLTFQTGDALIGVPPAVGDMIRIAYTVAGNDKKAVRIMNVTKQDIMKK